MTDAGGSSPRQAWAHRDGKIDLKPLKPEDWSPGAVAARAQIAEAFYRFGIGADEARPDVVASCFTDDGVFEVAEGQAEPFTRFTGRNEIEAGQASVNRLQGDQRRHQITNVVIQDLDLRGGAASALAYGNVVVAADGLSLGATVIYDAQLRRCHDGCWRFHYFFIGMDFYAGERP